MEKEVVLITGGSRGIGAAIVKKLSEEGKMVYFTYNKSEVESKFLADSLVDVYPLQLDISDYEQVEKTIKEIIEKEKRIDILINNAGITSDGSFLMMDKNKWSHVIDTNLNGSFYVSKFVAKNMLKQRKGRIINISSVVANIGSKGQANYISSKSAIEGLTKALAIELASRGILVNAIAPGYIETDMTNNLDNKYKEEIINKTLLKRCGYVDEIADVVSFLCSKSSSYITGQIITVDGGMSLNA
jgi:3-oxoacyl-[acyl-carrier protein] reductase